METIVLIAAFLIAIALGMRLIHLLNAQHDARIAVHHYPDALPGVGRRRRKHHGSASTPTAPVAHTDRARSQVLSPAGAPSPAEGTTSPLTTIETDTEALPPSGQAEVRIVAASPETARAVAEVLRHCFAGAEQRSYPAPGGGTRLHLTVDTETAAGPARSWLTSSRPPVGTHTETHADEI